jgi:hypothetical protein
MSKKQLNFLMLSCIILSIVGTLLLFDSFNYDSHFTNKHNNDYWVKIWQLRNHPEITYNYFHGLWLIPFGVMFAFILLILDFPSYEEIYKKLKKDLKQKIKKRGFIPLH